MFSERRETDLATIDPTALLGLFEPAEMDSTEIANEVRQELVAVMDETCRG